MDTADRELATSRVLDATPAQAFAAFAAPQRLALWWGPKGFTNTFDQFDLRPGGAWRFTMHGPDGSDYVNESRFVEIVPGERVVFEHLSQHWFEMTIGFEAQPGGRTRVSWRMVFDSVQHRDQIAEFVIPANEQNLDRLEAHLRATA
ncbi:MAG: SRPBCC domain-containing protein [Bacteroidia bacterium]|jgi:uncharacterized protein YndB with AHSA1/START domain